MRKNIFLHIGIHKTGTTFLQKKVFPFINGIKFEIKPDFGLVSGKKDTTMSKFMNSSPLIWKCMGKELIKKLEQRCEEESKKTDLLISDEHASEANDPLRISQHLNEFKRVAEDDYNLNVLIVIRRQDTWFSSAYAQISNRFESPSQKHFERWVKKNIRADKQLFSNFGARLKYNTLVRNIEDVVGPPHISIIPFELLRENPQMFVERCCEFLGKGVPNKLRLEETNKRSVSKRKWKIDSGKGRYIQLRPGGIFQFLLGRSRIWLPNLNEESREIVLSKSISERILEVYREENKNLNEYLGGEIEQYEYF